jgi:hypothetical protein
MSRYFIFVLLLICMACQSGIIPCPKVKPVRAKRTNIFRSSGTMSASASESAEEDKVTPKRSKGSDSKVISNVSEEEWDCPHPGNRKYMPRRVKANIRRNFEKINAVDRERADSLAAAQEKR